MSRSYKKGYHSHYRGDKECRKLYHRSERRQVKKLLKDELKFWDTDTNLEMPSDRIITKGKNYSCKFADPWSWPSDGRGGKFSQSLQSLRRDFNEDVLKTPWWRKGGSSRYYDGTIWDEYVRYRDNAYNTVPPKWYLSYRIPIGKRLVTSTNLSWNVVTESYDIFNTFYYETVYSDKEFILDHHPYTSDVPRNAVAVKFYKRNEWKYVQAGNDWGLISFLIHRKLVPLSIQTEEELIKWLLKHEEKIVKTWFKILYRK